VAFWRQEPPRSNPPSACGLKPAKGSLGLCWDTGEETTAWFPVGEIGSWGHIILTSPLWSFSAEPQALHRAESSLVTLQPSSNDGCSHSSAQRWTPASWWALQPSFVQQRADTGCKAVKSLLWYSLKTRMGPCGHICRWKS